MNTKNNTILITGGASGIGLALALSLLEQNNTVIICGRNEDKLKQVLQKYPKLHIITCDITINKDREALLSHMKKEFPKLNILINNAGIQHNYNFTDKIQHHDLIEEELSINLNSQIKLIDMFVEILSHQSASGIVNITSALAYVPKQSAPVYCASKAGFHVFTEALRYQLEKTSIKVFEVIPALVDTPMTQGRGKNKTSPEQLCSEVLHGLKTNKYEIKIGKAKFLLLLKRFIPSLANKILKSA